MIKCADSGKERAFPLVREKASSKLGAIANCAGSALHNLECTMHLKALSLSGLGAVELLMEPRDL